MPVYFILLVLLLYLLPGLLQTIAQAPPPPAEGVALGQQVPDDLVLEMVNHSSPTARLSDFKGKLLLLDFYGTWCSSSRAPMARLDSLQREFSDQLQVLLVSYTKAKDDKTSVEAFFQKWRNPDGSRYSMPSVVNDTTLVKLFPHRRIPHFAWIGPDGTLLAITQAEKVTAPVIKRLLKEGIPPESLQKDLDLSKPLYAAAHLSEKNALQYSMLVKGKVDDSPGRSQLFRQGEGSIRALNVNLSLLEMFELARTNLYPIYGSRKLELIDVDSSRLIQEKSGLSPAEWKKQHTYSYELVLPAGQEDNVYRIMLEDLNRYTGYHAALEERETDCLLLVRKGRKDRIKNKGGQPTNSLYSPQRPRLQNMPIQVLVARLNGNNDLPLLVVDQTRYSAPIDIELSSGFTDLQVLRRELQAYGLDLVPARKKVLVPVLRQQKTNTAFGLSTNN